MTSGYTVSRYDPRHRPHILELQRNLWSSDLASNDAYFSWKYEQNPYDSDISVYLAFQGEHLVGMRGFFGGRWEAGLPREEISLWAADDLVVAPEHRNRGVFTAIMNAAFEDLPARRKGFALNLGGQQLTVLGSLTMGWKSIGSLSPYGLPSRQYQRRYQWQRRLARMRGLWRLATARWLVMPSRFDRLDEWAAPISDRPLDVRITREPDLQGMAELVQRLGYDGRIRHVRDAEYFAWRFRHPLREYRFLYAGQSRLRGYLVLHRSRSDRDNATPIHLSDWEADSPEVAEGLLDAALKGGQFPAIAAWSTALPMVARATMIAKGFRPIQQERVARGTVSGLVRPLCTVTSPGDWVTAGRNVLDPDNWDLRMLYSMAG